MHAVLVIAWFACCLATPVITLAPPPVPGEPPVLSTANYDWYFNISGYGCSSSNGIVLADGSATSKQGCAEFCSAAPSDATALIIFYVVLDEQFHCRCKLDCQQLVDGYSDNEIYMRAPKPSTGLESTEAAAPTKSRGRSHKTPQSERSNSVEES